MPLLALVPHGVAPLAAFAGLLAAGLVALGPRYRLRAFVAPAALLGGVLGWGALSAVWSIDPLRSLLLELRLAGLFLTGIGLAAAAERVAAPWRMALFLLAGAALGLVLAGYDLVTGGGLTAQISVRGFRAARLDQIAIGLAILLLPMAAMLYRRGLAGAGAAAAAIAATAIYLLDDASAKAALLASLPMAALFYWQPRIFGRLAAALCALFILTAPLTLPRLEQIPGLFAAADSLKDSASHRLLIWSFTGDHIAARPFLGWGLDSSRAIPGGNREARPGQNWLPLHPHDAALQVWLELGIPGAALFAVLAAWFWLRLERLAGGRAYRAAAGGSLTAALAPLFAAYGVWQEWWIGTLALTLFLIIVMGRAAGPPQERPTPPPPSGSRAGDR
jgi:exopolysaccharide production protein ExoQ